MLAGVIWLERPTRSQPGQVLPSAAVDAENCLSCHRFRGLSRLDQATGEVRLFSCSIEYVAYQQGPHAQLKCTDCHERSEVSMIPHRVQTPVDCLRSCHISSAVGMAVEFSHTSVGKRLDHSAHSNEVLSNLQLTAPLLRAGQSNCLYCHDEPVFREAPDEWIRIRTDDPSDRCDTCHAQTLPLDTDYFTRHVLSRLQSARSIKPLAQTCAVCHSDPLILERFDGHDAVASYLHSFHGKAGLLGETRTATCVDCHRSQLGDVHLMAGKDTEGSSIHPDRLATTCRTTECHPSAPPEMTVAAVHLELDPGNPTLEYLVASVFVLLTAGVMLVYFLLIVLELLNHVFRRRSADHHRMIELARRLQAHPQARAMLSRTTPHQRIQHWMLALFFILLVLTGMPLKFADSAWSSQMVQAFGGLSVARLLHRVAGVILIGVFLYHFAYLIALLIRKVRAGRKSGTPVSVFRTMLEFPMVVTPKDVVQFGQLFSYLVFWRRKRPAFGQYNFMEKFEYWAVFWGMPVMGLTGIGLWAAGWVSQNFSGRALNFAFIIHSDEAFLAFIYIAVVHMFYVIFAPAVFPLSKGTLSGQAPPGEIAEGHRQRLEDVARIVNVPIPIDFVEKHTFLTRCKNIVGRIYAAGVCAAVAVIGFVSLSFLWGMLVASHHLPADIGSIPRKLDVAALSTGLVGTAHAAAPNESPVRTPLAHYHQIPQWQNANPGTNCTTSGCHAPLPHGERIETRAFLNMHTTFTDCVVCHGRTSDQALNVRWTSADGNLQDAPAVLQIAAWVERPTPTDAPGRLEFDATLRSLLRNAIEQTGGNAEIKTWLLRLETTVTDNELWLRSVEEIRRGIGLHVHGEYGAVLRLFSGNQPLGEPSVAERQAAAEFLKMGTKLSESRRKQLVGTIHERIRTDGLTCLTCHGSDSTFVDFQKLGFPPTRASSLKDNATINQIIAIEAGQTFHLPAFMETNDRK